ncbi:rve domain-containing protein/RVT_3 domain-containing protein, partial [Cephalotus follicularis]
TIKLVGLSTLIQVSPSGLKAQPTCPKPS